VSDLTAERSEQLDSIAPLLAGSLLIADQWVVRNAQTVEILDSVMVRRRYNRHFLLPPEDLRAKLDGGVVLPVFFLRKHNFVNCHVRDSGGRMRSLLSATEGDHLTFAILVWIGEEVLQRGLPPEFMRRLRKVPEVKTERPVDVFGPFDDPNTEEIVKSLAAPGPFKQMLDAAKVGYLLFAVVDPDAERQVLGFQLEQRVPGFSPPEYSWLKRKWLGWCRLVGWVSHSFRLELGFEHVAVPTHVDLEAPDGITFGQRRLSINVGRRAPGTNSRKARFRFMSRVGHPRDFVAVDVHPGDTALLRGWLAGIIVTAILAAVAIAFWTGGHPAGKTATSLLLLVPGAVPLLVVAHGENPYVTEVVRGLRYAVILLAGWMVVATGCVVLISSKQAKIVAIALTALTVFAAATTVILLATYLRSRPEYDAVEFVDDQLNRIA
jgi:hypothetical protein